MFQDHCVVLASSQSTCHHVGAFGFHFLWQRSGTVPMASMARISAFIRPNFYIRGSPSGHWMETMVPYALIIHCDIYPHHQHPNAVLKDVGCNEKWIMKSENWISQVGSFSDKKYNRSSLKILMPSVFPTKVLFIIGCSKRQMIALTFFLPIT